MPEIGAGWRLFYETVLGCVPVPPERRLSGDWLSAATGIPEARISGLHLRLPGYGSEGPTLELFEYGSMPEHPAAATNVPGFAHIAFAVDDVAATVGAVLRAGGQEVGRLTEVDIPGAGRIVFQYVADPEGNILELQKWIG